MEIKFRPGGKNIEVWQPVESLSALNSGTNGLQIERLRLELTRRVYHLIKKQDQCRATGGGVKYKMLTDY